MHACDVHLPTCKQHVLKATHFTTVKIKHDYKTGRKYEVHNIIILYETSGLMSRRR